VTQPAAVLLSLALAFSLLDWIAVARRLRALEYVCKPAAASAFLAAALALDPASTSSRTWCCVALALCVLGDTLLMLPRDAFLPGLAAFAAAQLSFTVSFALQNPTIARLVIGLGLVVPCALILTRRLLGAIVAEGDTTMVPPVGLYVVVIAAMVVSAIAGGTAFGIAGAILFLVSDSLIGEDRFVSPRVWHPVAIMVTYHLALAGLVLGLL
jgi:alkenylglycerophosphocholine hydrolase